MKKLEKTKQNNEYINIDILKNKSVYFCKSDYNSSTYYIFKISKVISTSPLIYEIYRGFMFYVPKDSNCKAFTYNIDKKEFNMDYKSDLYLMNEEEYLNTFRNFVKNEGLYVKDLPTKLIADI